MFHLLNIGVLYSGANSTRNENAHECVSNGPRRR